MNNTGLLKVMSIIFFIFGILGIIGSAIALVGSGLIAALVPQVGAILVIGCIIALVLAIVELLAGREGLAICKGAGNPAKAKTMAMVVLIFAIISTVLSIIPIAIMSSLGVPANVGMTVVTSIISVVLPILFLMGLKKAAE